MLTTALTKAASTDGLINLRFVERTKLNRILQEAGGIRQQLSEVFAQPKVKTSLKAEGAEFVIFVTYAAMLGNMIRVDARMVEVEPVAGEISQDHVFTADDPTPFKILADKLVNDLYKSLDISATPSGQFNLMAPPFNYEGPHDYEKSRTVLPQSLRTSLHNLKMRRANWMSTQARQYILGKDCAALAEMFPDIHYFLIGDISIFQVRQQIITIVHVVIVSRGCDNIIETQEKCDPDQLFDDVLIKKVVDRIAQDWEKVIKQ